ncbi:MAG: ABC transporter ATP-binding protein [Selenomonadales bacterium]|nr:ABC transporter ATP-binding protein [Selenomonadales bacterium]
MIIKATNIVKRYGELLALDHLTLEVREGEVLGLLGPNGSGKTTAINCILSLLTYEKGEISVFGQPMRPDAYAVKRNIGVVMQHVAVFDELTVQENTDYFCGLYIRDAKERRRLVEEALSFVGMADFRKFYPKKLSGGLLRRLNIACGIAHKPKLIILDEPTVAVDPQSRDNILEGILSLNRAGTTVLYTSHYMEEVERICSRVVILDKGKVVASGTKEALKDMISLGEKITAEVHGLTESQLAALRTMPNLLSVNYADSLLTVKALKGTSGIESILEWLKQQRVGFGRIYSERPTLNDVFLEITGKELRD